MYRKCTVSYTRFYNIYTSCVISPELSVVDLEDLIFQYSLFLRMFHLFFTIRDSVKKRLNFHAPFHYPLSIILLGTTPEFNSMRYEFKHYILLAWKNSLNWTSGSYNNLVLKENLRFSSINYYGDIEYLLMVSLGNKSLDQNPNISSPQIKFYNLLKKYGEKTMFNCVLINDVKYRINDFICTVACILE
eukprot:TRINITY_DN1205_c0_g2_i10.p1 TRINITY_DN1205_c0_g2~~TRINITY_DN1205_c0_g2_i10.p1  ORF type:complete len:189 (+),score=15.82 TRINITY_DN1205_c0_g2_i10:290-856(+)